MLHPLWLAAHSEQGYAYLSAVEKHHIQNLKLTYEAPLYRDFKMVLEAKNVEITGKKKSGLHRSKACQSLCLNRISIPKG